MDAGGAATLALDTGDTANLDLALDAGDTATLALGAGATAALFGLALTLALGAVASAAFTGVACATALAASAEFVSARARLAAGAVDVDAASPSELWDDDSTGFPGTFLLSPIERLRVGAAAVAASGVVVARVAASASVGAVVMDAAGENAESAAGAAVLGDAAGAA